MKIQSLGTPREWESKYGKLYEIEAVLDNGKAGTVNCKRPDTWKVGDEVEVIESEGKYGTLFKFSRPEKAQGQFSAPSSDVQKRIDCSWAIGQAIAAGGRTLEDIEQIASELLSLRDKMLSK